MRFKDKFPPLEWQTLQFSIMWVFQSVAGADGHIDHKEQMAIKYVTTNSWKFQCDLVSELLEAMHVNPAHVFKMSKADVRGIENGLKSAAKMVEAKVSIQEAIMFKKSLIAIGYLVANMSGEENSSLKNLSNISVEEMDALAKAAYYINLDADSMAQPPTVQEIVKGLMQK